MDDVRIGENGAKLVFRRPESRADDGSAKRIIEAEARARDEKTARLRAARLARDAAANPS